MDSNSPTPVSLSLQLPADPATPANRFLTLARDYVIDGPETLQAAADDVTTIVQRKKMLDEQRQSILQPARQIVDRINSWFRPAIDVLEQAERTLKGKISAHQIAEQRKADEARRQAEEAARVERERMTREAAEREQAAQAEATRQREEAARAAQAGRVETAVALETQATITESAGRAEAEQLATAAASMPTIRPAVAPKPTGVSMRENWTAEVDNKLELIRAVAEGKVSIELLEVNMTALNGMARSLKASLSVPGVRAVNNPVVAAGRRRAA